MYFTERVKLALASATLHQCILQNISWPSDPINNRFSPGSILQLVASSKFVGVTVAQPFSIMDSAALILHCPELCAITGLFKLSLMTNELCLENHIAGWCDLSR